MCNVVVLRGRTEHRVIGRTSRTRFNYYCVKNGISTKELNFINFFFFFFTPIIGNGVIQCYQGPDLNVSKYCWCFQGLSY